MSHLCIGCHSDRSTKLFDGHKRYCDGQWPLTSRYFKRWIKILNSLDSSRPYRRLLEILNIGDCSESFLPENDFKTCSAINFPPKYPDFGGLLHAPLHMNSICKNCFGHLIGTSSKCQQVFMTKLKQISQKG